MTDPLMQMDYSRPTYSPADSSSAQRLLNSSAVRTATPIAEMGSWGAASNTSSTTFTYDPDAKVEDNLERMYEAQYQQFLEYQKPLIEWTEDELQSNDIIKRADADVARLDATTRGQTNRQLNRFVGTPTVAQKTAIDRNLDRSITSSKSGITNTARAGQQTYNDALRADLVEAGSALQEGSLSSLTTISQRSAERKAANEANSSSTMGQIGSLAGTVIGAYFGGPAGAAVGGAIGTAAGQQLG